MIFGRGRDELTFDYYDLSEDREAWRYTALDDDVEIELRRAGFRPLGVVNAVLRAHKRMQLTLQVWATEDGRVMTNGPDELATLFEDGTIVKTTRKPPWSFFMRGRWVLRMHREDRHPHELVDGTLAQRLAAHLERVAQVEKTTSVVAVRSMAEYFAVRLRDAELRISRQRPEHVVALWTTAIVSLAGAIAPIVWTAHHHVRARELGPRLTMTFQLTAVFFISLFIVALPLRAVMLTWVGPWIVRLRPGPPPRPAAEWIEHARQIPASTLRDARELVAPVSSAER